MDLNQRINAFVELGNFIGEFSDTKVKQNHNNTENLSFVEGFKHQMKLASTSNGWFSKQNMQYAFKVWAKTLTEQNLLEWTKPYDFNLKSNKTIALIMAGNVPLVGFHDLLCVLISGHRALVKLSSNDKHLLPYLAKYLETIVPAFKEQIQFTNTKLNDFNFDAVIATGSNNTSRYFEYYFKGKPSIIRKNRNSVAVLNGQETDMQLKALSEDIFRYYGLGCRNVSKLFVPKDYNFNAFFKAVYHWHPIINETKYANNYDYNKAVYLMSEFDILDNGFLMLKEDGHMSSPIATLFYETYDSLESLKYTLNNQKKNIQCIVSEGFIPNEIAFGQTQHPQLWDYADTKDTIDFLLTL